ncbi:MAG TPA: hypothetical protein VGI22_10185 [Xanthobacteraceae bacterium]
MPQRIIFVPAILVILIAAVSMGARSGLAADSCVGKPGATAPQGEHWYYHLDRTAHRLCWYLGPEGGKVAQAGTPHLRSATRRTDPHPAALATAEPSAEALAAFAARTGVVTGGNGTTLGENPSEPRFITRWSNHPGPSDATAYEVASTSSDDAARPASVNAPADLLPTEPVRELSARATAGVSNETPFGFVRMLGLIGGALAFAVLIFRSAAAQPAGGLTARSKSLDHERSSAAVFRPPVGAHSFGIPRSFGRRSAGAMRRNVIAGEPGDRDDSGHSLGAAWILSQAIRDR